MMMKWPQTDILFPFFRLCAEICTLSGTQQFFQTFDGDAYYFPGSSDGSCQYVMLEYNDIKVLIQGYKCRGTETMCTKSLEIQLGEGLTMTMARSKGVDINGQNYPEGTINNILDGIQVRLTALTYHILARNFVITWDQGEQLKCI